MKILLVATHYDVCSGRYIADAFTRAGCDVRHIGERGNLAEAWNVPTISGLGERGAWLPDGVLYQQWPSWRPDLIVLADSTLVGYHNEVYADVPMVVYGVDNHVRHYRQDGVARYFLAHYHGAVHPVRDVDEEWLPCAYDPNVFTPSTIPWKQRDYDVCMLGVMYQRRYDLIQALADAGISTYTGTGLVYEAYRNAYQNARISLCVSANGDLAQRVFETAAMGCLVFTDPLTDLSDERTNAALGLAGFSVYWSIAECVKHVQELLINTTMAEGGARALQTAVMRRHKWDDRVGRILEWFQEYKGVTHAIEHRT